MVVGHVKIWRKFILGRENLGWMELMSLKNQKRVVQETSKQEGKWLRMRSER